MLIETWLIVLLMDEDSAGGGVGQLSVLRLLRLARLTRMVRIMRAFPELLVLIKGIIASTRSVSMTLFLLLLFCYIFAIIFRQAEVLMGPKMGLHKNTKKSRSKGLL